MDLEASLATTSRSGLSLPNKSQLATIALNRAMSSLVSLSPVSTRDFA